MHHAYVEPKKNKGNKLELILSEFLKFGDCFQHMGWSAI